MARELVPIKVHIGLKEEGGAKYPDFGSLAAVRAANTEWYYYVDRNGPGWLYDNTCGHKEDSTDSPVGMQWGVLLVPVEFAKEAVEKFPEVTEISEAELEEFYNTKYNVRMMDEDIDDRTLYRIKLKIDLLGKDSLTDEQKKAIDVTNDTMGIRKNKRKYWKDFKKFKGIKVVKIR